jgi:hypothetical protein
MSLTSLIKPIFTPRLKAIDRYALQAEAIQRSVLDRLLQRAAATEWGRRYHFNAMHDAENYEKLFAPNVPISTYEDLKGDIDRMRRGATDVLWPGSVRWYAKSSGTTNDVSKFIPVSREGLQQIHYAGGRDAVALYLRNTPGSRLFDGKALILGGSHAPNYNLPQSLVGDLSAILIENIHPLVNLVRIPPKSIALLPDFEEKCERIARLACHKDVTNLSGVPSWMMAVVHRVLDITGAANLSEVWPHLEVFFHGGVAFTPYREQYHHLVPSSGMHYMETYNASEGFFGLQDDPADPSLLLMIDYDVFYEFIPLEDVGSEHPRVVPLWGVETGRNYAIVITTSCGLWRYLIGDTVRFTSVQPYKFVISGRTKSFINAFGEELIVDNAEKGLVEACRQTGAEVHEYTAAPVFMDDRGKCRHQWVVEFDRCPDSVEHFADVLDDALRRINSDYDAKRHKDITLQRLEIVVARPGLFNEWLKSCGKLGGQHKVPRLANHRDIIEPLLQLNAERPS